MSSADFIERRRPLEGFRDDPDTGHALLADASEALHRRGATWQRAHRTPTGEIIVEGWRVRPRQDAEGSLPL